MSAPTVVEAITIFVLVYFVVMNLGYLVLNALSLASLWRGQQEQVLDDLPQVYSGLDPAISLLVPAYNEEASIADSIRSMLQLNYANVEIVVINDGSKDGTLAVLQREFGLEPFPQAMHERLQTQPVRAVYRSRLHPTLRVIDKENGGKADSLNAGINLARHELFCGVDADSILERDSLQKVVKPFLRDPRVVASGGTVRVANGCDIEGGFLTRVNLPRNLWALFQVVEYLRAFLFGRLGWSQLNAMLIISGAFGLFRKDVVIEVGGYKPKTIGEDMELVVRMHRHLRSQSADLLGADGPRHVFAIEHDASRAKVRLRAARQRRGRRSTVSTRRPWADRPR